jgi:hypothetical protein
MNKTMNEVFPLQPLSTSAHFSRWPGPAQPARISPVLSLPFTTYFFVAIIKKKLKKTHGSLEE